MKWLENGGNEYERPSTGSHLARCFSIIDLGSQEHDFAGKKKVVRDVQMAFELTDELMKGTTKRENAGKPFAVYTTLTQSLNEKSRMRKLLEGWRGKRFDTAAIEAFQPRALLGQPCRLTLVEGASGYINIDSIAPASKQEAKSMPAMFNPICYFSMYPGEFDRRIFEGLHEKTKNKIQLSPEWRHLQKEAADPPQDVNTGFDPAEDTDMVDPPDPEVIPF